MFYFRFCLLCILWGILSSLMGHPITIDGQIDYNNLLIVFIGNFMIVIGHFRG